MSPFLCIIAVHYALPADEVISCLAPHMAVNDFIFYPLLRPRSSRYNNQQPNNCIQNDFEDPSPMSDLIRWVYGSKTFVLRPTPLGASSLFAFTNIVLSRFRPLFRLFTFYVYGFIGRWTTHTFIGFDGFQSRTLPAANLSHS